MIKYGYPSSNSLPGFFTEEQRDKRYVEEFSNSYLRSCSPALSVIYQSIIRAGEREMKPVVG